MIVGGISGYFGGWIDSVLMRLVEVLMTTSIYLLVALAAVLPPANQYRAICANCVNYSFIGGLARVIRTSAVN